MSLEKGTFWCLPDGYEIVDPSLDDIKRAFKPVYTKEEIAQIDNQTDLSRDLFGRRYLPGFVGLNNLNKTDCINATIQALVHVKPLRDFFLQCGDGKPFELVLKNSSSKKRQRNGHHKTVKTITVDPESFSHLAKMFGDLVRKIWSDKRFKSTVDPHMLVQAISNDSNKRFHVGKQIEAGEFMAWFLHQLHLGTGGKKPGSSIIHEIFQGSIEVTTQRTKVLQLSDGKEDTDDRYGSEDENEVEMKEKELQQQKTMNNTNEMEEIINETNFLQLTLDIPEKPLFKDDAGGLVIPQEPLVNILQKFDGVTFSDVLTAQGLQRRRYKVKQLPNYLILCVARFKKNEFNNEKNPTIVPFPVKNLDLGRYVMSSSDGGKTSAPSEDQVRGMSVKELRELLKKHDREDLGAGVVEKGELVDVCINFVSKSLPDLLSHKYDLVANITHNIPSEVGREGKVDPLQEGTYHCHVQHKATQKWYDIQDLDVRETMPQLIGVSEAYIMIFEKKGL